MDVRRHDLTANDAETIERTARRLARAFGYGTGWRMPDTANLDPVESDATTRGHWTGGLLNDTTEERMARMAPDTEAELPCDVLQVVKRGRHVAEGAARPVTGPNGRRTTGVRARHYWNVQRGQVLRPICSMDTDALTALANLSPIRQAMVRLYAGQFQAWPEVARWCMARGHRIEACSAAMDRVLWKRPDRTLAEHAWAIEMRQCDFRALVRLARADLDRLLMAASRQFMTALGGTRNHPANYFISRNEENSAGLSDSLLRAAA